MVVAVLLVGGGTVGWFAWSAAENTRQSEAREAEAQHAADDAAAKKKAKSDAYWAKAQAEDKAAQAKETQAAAARASADRAAAASPCRCWLDRGGPWHFTRLIHPTTPAPIPPAASST